MYALNIYDVISNAVCFLWTMYILGLCSLELRKIFLEKFHATQIAEYILVQ